MDGAEDGQGRWVVHGERTLYDNRWVRLGKADITTPSGNRFVGVFSASVGRVLTAREEIARNCGWRGAEACRWNGSVRAILGSAHPLTAGEELEAPYARYHLPWWELSDSVRNRLR